MPGQTDEQYYAAQEEAARRRSGKAERASTRRARETGAARGTLYSGVQTRREAEISGQSQEELRQAYLDIDRERFGSRQREMDRAHQQAMQESQQTWGTGERVGSQGWQTGERTGTQDWQGQQAGLQRDWQTGERLGGESHQFDINKQQFGYAGQLQGQAEQARYELQELVNSGQMDMQDASNAWQGIQNDLNRDLQMWSERGQMAHETQIQERQITQDQWSQMNRNEQEQWLAEFGSEHDITIQNMANNFEENMARLGRDWEVADQRWEQEMYAMDAQLQLTINGWNWGGDQYTGYAPLWFYEGVGAEGMLLPESEGHQSSGFMDLWNSIF